MTANGEGSLTDEQIAYFAEHGYVVVDFLFDVELLDRVVEKVDSLYDENYHSDPTLPARAQNAWHSIDEVRQLAVDSRVLSALQQLVGRKALPFQTLNFPIGTRQKPHSDTVHFNSMPKGFMAGVWVALEDIDENNGPLVYYPGSHKLREYTMQDFGLEPGYDNYQKYEECIQELVERERLVAEYGTIKKGEALIWHANLLHGGASQKDLSRTRHSQVTHYFFEDCKYYTPMDSTAETPFWIPDTADFSLPGTDLLSRIRTKLGFD